MHAARSGLATILCNTHGSAGRERDYVRMLLERGVEGMLFISAEITDVRGRHSHYAKLLERGARLVFVNGGSEELDVTSVGVDERAAGRIATEHLIELGHERIGFVAGDEYALPTREKALGHGDALRAAQLTDGLVAHSSFTVGGGREALRELLAKPEARAPDGGDLLERPHGDRRAAGERAPRSAACPKSSRSSASTASTRPRGRIPRSRPSSSRSTRSRVRPSRRCGARSRGRPSDSRATSSGRVCGSAARRLRRRARPRRRRSPRSVSNATPFSSRYVASPSRAKTRVAACATQRSEKPSPT